MLLNIGVFGRGLFLLKRQESVVCTHSHGRGYVSLLDRGPPAKIVMVAMFIITKREEHGKTVLQRAGRGVTRGGGRALKAVQETDYYAHGGVSKKGPLSLRRALQETAVPKYLHNLVEDISVVGKFPETGLRGGRRRWEGKLWLFCSGMLPAGRCQTGRDGYSVRRRGMLSVEGYAPVPGGTGGGPHIRYRGAPGHFSDLAGCGRRKEADLSALSRKRRGPVRPVAQQKQEGQPWTRPIRRAGSLLAKHGGGRPLLQQAGTVYEEHLF